MFVTDTTVSSLQISSFHFQCSDLFGGSKENWVTVVESS